MSKPCVIYVVRHGESIHNRDSIISGHVNPPLTEKGKEQARATKTVLDSIKFDQVYSSDLQRAVETAKIIYGKPVPKNHQLKGLRERTYGDIDGKHSSHLDGSHKKLMSMPPNKRWHYSHAPGMETDRELANRFLDTLKGIAVKNEGKTILVVAHSGCLKILLMKVGNATHEQMGPGAIKNAGYVEVIFDGTGFKIQQAEVIHKP